MPLNPSNRSKNVVLKVVFDIGILVVYLPALTSVGSE